MKRIIAAVAVMGILALPWAASSLQAADNTTVDVVMSIQSVDVTLLNGATTFTVATAVAAKKIVPPEPANLRNTGNFFQDYQVKAEKIADTGGWTQNNLTDGSPVGVNEYRLRGIWAVFGATITVNSFETDDVITGTSQTSSATRFFSAAGTQANVGTTAANGGFNIPALGERSLSLLFESGAATTTGSSAARITITGIATP